jgi:hypothetical protein
LAGQSIAFYRDFRTKLAAQLCVELGGQLPSTYLQLLTIGHTPEVSRNHPIGAS